MTVIFHYRAGHEKPMAERYAKLLQRMGHGYYRTEEPEPIHLPEPVPVVAHEEIAVQAREAPLVFKARRGRKPKLKPHTQPETQPETKTDND